MPEISITKAPYPNAGETLWVTIGFTSSTFDKFIDLRNNGLGAFYMEYIVKLDNEAGNSIPVKQAKDFFA
jgi:hypothetical protein